MLHKHDIVKDGNGSWRNTDSCNSYYDAYTMYMYTDISISTPSPPRLEVELKETKAESLQKSEQIRRYKYTCTLYLPHLMAYTVHVVSMHAIIVIFPSLSLSPSPTPPSLSPSLPPPLLSLSLSLTPFSLEGSSNQLKVELERSPKQQDMERWVHIHVQRHT